jgi:hypothetical protein
MAAHVSCEHSLVLTVPSSRVSRGHRAAPSDRRLPPSSIAGRAPEYPGREVGAPDAAENPSPRLCLAQLGVAPALPFGRDLARFLAHLGRAAETPCRAEATSRGHLCRTRAVFPAKRIEHPDDRLNVGPRLPAVRVSIAGGPQ